MTQLAPVDPLFLPGQWPIQFKTSCRLSLPTQKISTEPQDFSFGGAQLRPVAVGHGGFEFLPAIYTSSVRPKREPYVVAAKT